MDSRTKQTIKHSTMASLLAGLPSAEAAIYYNANQYSAGIQHAILWDIDGLNTTSVFVSTSSGFPNLTTLVSSHSGVDAVVFNNASGVYMIGAQALQSTGSNAAYANVTFVSTTSTTCGCGIPTVIKLLAGDAINGTHFSASSAGFGYFYPGQFAPNASQYFGFAFSPDGINLHYGWAAVELNTSTLTVELQGWAFETTREETITAGAVPEPETAALGLAGLAAGAAGLRRWRKRKAA